MSRGTARVGLIVCASLCATVAALWVRSYFVADRYPEALSGSGLRVASWDGRVFLEWFRTDRPRSRQLFVLVPVPRIEGDSRNPDDRPSRREVFNAFERSIGAAIIQPPRITLPSAHLSNGLGFADASVTVRSGGTVSDGLHVLGVPFWAVFAVPAGLSIHFWGKQRRMRRPGLCRNCGYDLRATPERCPECGTSII